MLRTRLPLAARSLLIVGFGLLLLASPVTQSMFAVALPACVVGIPVIAWVGVQLNVLTIVSHCPSGSYAPGEHFGEAAHVGFALSLSALVVGLASLAVALGAGIWLRRAAATAHRWIITRTRFVRWVRSWTPVTREQPVLVPVSTRQRAQHAPPPARRGPPRSC
jgi:hypothetical protein